MPVVPAFDVWKKDPCGCDALEFLAKTKAPMENAGWGSRGSPPQKKFFSKSSFTTSNPLFSLLGPDQDRGSAAVNGANANMVEDD